MPAPLPPPPQPARVAPKIRAAREIASATRRTGSCMDPPDCDELRMRAASHIAASAANVSQRPRESGRFGRGELAGGTLPLETVEIESDSLAPPALGVIVDGLNVQVPSAGRPVPQLSVSTAEKPSNAITGMVKVAVAPALIVATVGETGPKA